MIVLDIEASGLDPATHSIVSIGALELERPERQFYEECRIWDGARIAEEALQVNGFTTEELMDVSKKSEEAIVRAFLEWALESGEHTLAGQNVSFDRDYLRHAALRYHLDWPFAHRTLDTHTLCYMHMVKRGLTPPTENRRSKLDLDAILNYCGIPAEPKPHNALTGAYCHAEVASRLLYDKQLLDGFKQYPIPWISS